MPYAIAILLALLAGSGYLLKGEYEKNGALYESKNQLTLDVQRVEGEKTAMTIGYAAELAVINTALTYERKGRDRADRATKKAEDRLRSVSPNICYDSPIPDGAAIGVQQALSIYTGPYIKNDPRYPAATGHPTCRDLVGYIPRLVQTITGLNNQLEAIKIHQSK